jgi:16S rRNA processing protein RimM
VPGWEDYALVGRVARAHGIRGQVIVNPETDFLEARFKPGAVLHVQRGGRVEALRVMTMRVHQGRPIVGIEGIETMNDAETLAGLELRIPAEELEPLPAGVFYRHDLVGCRVETVGGEAVGEVSKVEGEMSTSRLVVQSPTGEVLIPMAETICVMIDTAARRIVVDPPPGLLDVNRRP